MRAEAEAARRAALERATDEEMEEFPEAVRGKRSVRRLLRLSLMLEERAVQAFEGGAKRELVDLASKLTTATSELIARLPLPRPEASEPVRIYASTAEWIEGSWFRAMQSLVRESPSLCPFCHNRCGGPHAPFPDTWEEYRERYPVTPAPTSATAGNGAAPVAADESARFRVAAAMPEREMLPLEQPDMRTPDERRALEAARASAARDRARDEALNAALTKCDVPRGGARVWRKPTWGGVE